MAQTAPERELDALHALQHARYVEGRDNADPAVIADVLCSLGLQAAAAVLHKSHDALRAALLERVASARATMQLLGAQGVPQLAVAGQGGALRLVGGDALLGPREALLARVQRLRPEAAERPTFEPLEPFGLSLLKCGVRLHRLSPNGVVWSQVGSPKPVHAEPVEARHGLQQAQLERGKTKGSPVVSLQLHSIDGSINTLAPVLRGP